MIEKIITQVATYYHTTPEELRQMRRQMNVVDARRASVMILLSLGVSKREVSERLNFKGYNNINRAIRDHNLYMRVNPSYKRRFEEISHESLQDEKKVDNEISTHDA